MLVWNDNLPQLCNELSQRGVLGLALSTSEFLGPAPGPLEIHHKTSGENKQQLVQLSVLSSPGAGLATQVHERSCWYGDASAVSRDPSPILVN